MKGIHDISIALACETSLDTEILRHLINASLIPKNYKVKIKEGNIWEKSTKINHNDIKDILEFSKKVHKKTKLLIIITDRDNDDGRIKKLQEKINQSKLYLDHILVAPEENIEDWLLSDKKAVSNELHFLVDKYLIKGEDAKKQLDYLIGIAKSEQNYINSQSARIQARINIAKRIDLKRIQKDDLKEFLQKIASYIQNRLDNNKFAKNSIKKRYSTKKTIFTKKNKKRFIKAIIPSKFDKLTSLIEKSQKNTKIILG